MPPLIVVSLSGSFYALNTNEISITHSEFVNNTVPGDRRLVYLDGIMVTLKLSEFINNRAGKAVVHIPFFTIVENHIITY